MQGPKLASRSLSSTPGRRSMVAETSRWPQLGPQRQPPTRHTVNI